MTELTNEKKTWKDRIPTFIAITTLLLAAFATLTAFKAAGYGNRMVLAQSQASDQWAFYQAKSIKETQNQVQRDAMVAVYSEMRTDAINKQIEVYDKEVNRYKNEKDDIAKEAKKLELERDFARKYNTVYGQALMFLQVGILLSSLASINKVNGYWYAGAVSGAVGLGLFAYAMVIL